MIRKVTRKTPKYREELKKIRESLSQLSAKEREEVWLQMGKSSKRGKGKLKNPVGKPVEIYSDILAIEAKKGKSSAFSEKLFRHDFKTKSKAKIFGMPDGSILIKPKKGVKLWKNFQYTDAEIEADDFE